MAKLDQRSNMIARSWALHVLRDYCSLIFKEGGRRRWWRPVGRFIIAIRAEPPVLNGIVVDGKCLSKRYFINGYVKITKLFIGNDGGGEAGGVGSEECTQNTFLKFH